MVRTHGVAIGHAGLMLGLILASGGLCGLLAGGWCADCQIAAGRMDGHARVGFYAAILVNNAALLDVSPFSEMTEEKFNRIMTVNATGTFLGAKAVGPVME